MKSGKRQIMEGIELLNQERIRTLGEKENYKYLGLLEANIIKQAKMKKKKKKKEKSISDEREKFLVTKLSNRNLIKGINIWVVSLVRYSRPFLKWTREEIRQIDQRTSKLMIHKVLHPREDIDRLYMCQEKKELEDSPSLKMASIHQ